MQAYETVIGLEVHVQLATQSKIFCSDDASFGGAPNTHTSPISLAHPGTLPRVNQRAVEYAVKLGLALGCEINLHSSFDRKNYFYADLPKGYQITQDKSPICIGGQLTTRPPSTINRLPSTVYHLPSTSTTFTSKKTPAKVSTTRTPTTHSSTSTARACPCSKS